ncbi:hypothetical protein [Lysinibacillus sp. Y5S-8]|uniref:hypothetical protein n=1 Tax=Lysinibacillus sp. Y5S-8 TaxID=3122488 RepID=UPI0011538370
MTKIYMMSITKNIDEQVWEQKVIEKIFEKKSKLKAYLCKEGYLKESKNQYVKINEASIYVATIQKIKIT